MTEKNLHDFTLQIEGRTFFAPIDILDFPLLFFPCQFHWHVITSGEQNEVKALGNRLSILSNNPKTLNSSLWRNENAQNELSQRDWKFLIFEILIKFHAFLYRSTRTMLYDVINEQLETANSYAVRYGHKIKFWLCFACFWPFNANWKELHGSRCKTSDGVVGTLGKICNGFGKEKIMPWTLLK